VYKILEVQKEINLIEAISIQCLVCFAF